MEGISALTLAGRAGNLGYKQGLKTLGIGGLGLQVAEELPGMARQLYDTGSVVDPIRSLVSSLVSSYAMGLITKEEVDAQLGRILGQPQGGSDIERLMMALQPGAAP